MPKKNSDQSPGQKLLSLYTLFMVKGDRYTSLKDLAEALDCSKQTVLRLLAQLESSHYGKLEEPMRLGRENYYRLAPAQNKKLNIGAEELAQLTLCRDFLLSILPMGIQRLMFDKKHEINDEPNSMIYTKGAIDYSPFQKQYATLMQAIRQKRVCNVGYRKKPGLPPRIFSYAPLRMVSYHESIAFMGWEVSPSGKAVPKFKKPMLIYLQRCLSVSLTQRSSANLPDSGELFEPTGAFGIMRGENFPVKLKFSPHAAAYVHDRQWSEDQKMELLEDGSLILEISAASKPEIISWVLSFGKNVEAIAPEWLKGEIAAQARELAARYEIEPEAAGNPD